MGVSKDRTRDCQDHVHVGFVHFAQCESRQGVWVSQTCRFQAMYCRFWRVAGGDCEMMTNKDCSKGYGS